jgi:rhodanese-related sulfurtransferase
MKYLAFISISILFISLSCKNESHSTQRTSIIDGLVDAEEFARLLKSENQLIDVRTPEEFAEGYIPDARNIDFRSEGFEQQLKSLDQSKPVLVYCKSGGRSGKTYTMLKDKGFDKVFDLKGGFTEWSNSDKPSSK